MLILDQIVIMQTKMVVTEEASIVIQSFLFIFFLLPDILFSC